MRLTITSAWSRIRPRERRLEESCPLADFSVLIRSVPTGYYRIED